MDIFNGGYTGANMVANVSNAVQTTFASIAPIVALAVGIVFAFVLSKYLIGLFKEAGHTTKYDIASLHESEDGSHLVGTPLGDDDDYDAYKDNRSRYLSQDEISAQFPLMRKD